MGNYIINVTKDELNLDKTLDSGQAFRWQKNSEGYWVGVVKDIQKGKSKLCILKQYDSYISTNLSEAEAELLIYYFNLDMSYTDEIEKLNLSEKDEFAYKAYQRGKGIHILRQDYFETMVTFLMSTCNTMGNIRNIVNKLSELYGEKLEEEYNGKSYAEYTFPTLKRLRDVSIKELEACKMGFRARYLAEMCQRLSKDSTILERLHQGMDGGMTKYAEAIMILTEFKGIGEKVANCISLFAGHHLCAFPVDTHIRQLIDTEYRGNINLNNYGKIAGIVQQYMYYYKAF